jgi:hypothetical protein
MTDDKILANLVIEELERDGFTETAAALRRLVTGAERYQWLRQPSTDPLSPDCWWDEHRIVGLWNYDEIGHLMGEELDAAIDAAMKQS